MPGAVVEAELRLKSEFPEALPGRSGGAFSCAGIIFRHSPPINVPHLAVPSIGDLYGWLGLL